MQTIKEIQEEILEDFDMFEDWMQKYEYLIDLGKDLPSIEEKHKIEDNLIKGASGQAIQSFNLMCGFDVQTGLNL